MFNVELPLQHVFITPVLVTFPATLSVWLLKFKVPDVTVRLPCIVFVPLKKAPFTVWPGQFQTKLPKVTPLNAAGLFAVIPVTIHVEVAAGYIEIGRASCRERV